MYSSMEDVVVSSSEKSLLAVPYTDVSSSLKLSIELVSVDEVIVLVEVGANDEVELNVVVVELIVVVVELTVVGAKVVCCSLSSVTLAMSSNVGG